MAFYAPQSQPAEDLDSQPFNLVPYGPDLRCQVAGVVGRDASCNDRTADAAGSSKLHLTRHEYVGNVLVLAEERDM